jgi:TonB-linked SusC/RagA family outer membrane protein
MKNKLLRFIIMISNLTLKVTVIQILFLTIAFGYDSKAQQNKSIKNATINIGFHNADISDVLKTIEKETGYRFIYDAKDLSQSKRFTVNAKSRTVADLLTELSKQYNLQFRQINNNISIKKASRKGIIKEPAIQIIIDEVDVTGRVISGEDNEALPGVNVVVKGTSHGTITDANGNYAITVASEEAILVFSSVGFNTEEVLVGSRSVIDVSLAPDITQLEELVVIGYGTQKKSDLTGAISSVSEEDMKVTIVNSFEQALQGRAAGVQVFQNSGQPGGGVSIRIRGANSVNSSAEPLYVIDGIPIEGDAAGTAVGFDWAGGGNGQTAVSALATINPSDIVSIEVLKDASATAIYGSRGANGVVLITTKRGKAGEAKFEYDGYFGIQQPSKYMDVMNLREYAEYSNEMAELGFTTQREEFLDPSLLGEGTDWQREVFKDATIQNHQLTISGGNDKTTYAVTGGYFDQNGIVVGSWFKRYSVRLNLDTEAKPWLKFGTTMMLTRTDERITLNDSDNGVIAATLTQAPDIPVRFPDGSWGGPYLTEFGVTNPVAMALDRDLEVKRLRLLANAYADFKLADFLTFRTEIGTDIQSIDNFAFDPTYEYGTVINEQNKSRRSFTHNYFWIWKNYFTYNQTFADRHNVTVMLGQESQESQWDGLEGYRNSFVSNDIQELNAGDATTATNSGWKGSSSLLSYFARANYIFDDRYLFTATFRADGSSKFGPENKWGYFPSFALAWKASNEQFMSGVGSVSNLKLRLGYGQVGNQNIGNYRYGSSLKTAPSGVGNGFLLNNIPNPELKWETSTTYNIGLDLGFLDDRLNLMVDVYRRDTEDMLITAPIPNYLGGGSWMGIEAPWVNLGELRNTGYEITLNTVPISNADWSWSSDLIFSQNENEVISLGDESLFYDVNVQWFHHVTRTAVGKPIGQLYGYVVEGIFEDQADIEAHATQNDKVDRLSGVWPGDLKFKDISGPEGVPDGSIDATYDRTYIGNPYPDFSFGWNNSVKFKDFDFTVYVQGTYGNDIYNFTRRQTEGMTGIYSNHLKTVDNRARVVSDIEDADPDDVSLWYVQNPDTEMPRAIPPDPNDNLRVSSRYVEDGSYLRVKNIVLGYNLPNTIVSKIKARSLRVYVNLQNIYTLTNYSGYDPEIGSYNQDPLLTGVDNGRYPLPRMYTAGLTLGF